MAKIGDLFPNKPKQKFNPVDFTSISPEKLWVHYNDLADSIVCYFAGGPVRAVSHYLDDDSYVMVEPQSRDVVGIHLEVLEREFIAKYPVLAASWPHVKATLEIDDCVSLHLARYFY